MGMNLAVLDLKQPVAEHPAGNPAASADRAGGPACADRDPASRVRTDRPAPPTANAATSAIGNVTSGSAQPEDLDLILRPGIALAQWWRTFSIDVPPDVVAKVGMRRVVAPADQVAVQLKHALADLPCGGWQDAVAQDAEHLARRFAPIAGCAQIAVRLEGVTGDSCRRFHADYVPVRLITTYVGPGTQWRIGGEDAPVHDIATGAVALFKGRAWAPETTLLHRSPPIAGTGTHRLVLVIDVAQDTEPQAFTRAS